MNIRSRQKGATLIVTLIILTVITIIGISAIRGSSLNLSIATNSQVRVLLFEAADAGLVTVEQVVASDPAAAQKATGIMGAALSAPGVEKVRCMSRGSATLLRDSTCDLDQATDFTSGRQVNVVQTAVLSPQDEAGESKKAIVLGQDSDALPSYLVEVYSTSVMPNLGDASKAKIEECLNKDSDDSKVPANTTITECLSNEGATFATTVQEYCYGFFCYPSS